MSENTASQPQGAAFEWIPFYEDLAHALLPYRYKQNELIQFLADLHEAGIIGISLEDKDARERRFPLAEIDGFTFFANFNRAISSDKRTAILRKVKDRFQIQPEAPVDFSGVPLVNNQSSWFFSYADKRKPEDIGVLWEVFAQALAPNPLAQPGFEQAFDRALQVRNTSINLTMGLFWIRPDEFLNLDSVNRSFLNLKLPRSGLSFAYYKDVIERVRESHPDFPRLSHAAWLVSQREADTAKAKKTLLRQTAHEGSESRFWLFQANPKIYDIDAALRHLTELAWTVSTHRDQINPGDMVYFWKSGADAGIIGRGTVLAHPAVSTSPDEENRFAKEPAKSGAEQLRVRVRIDEVFDPPTTRSRVKSDPRLSALSILRLSRGTQFPVSPDEAEILDELIQSSGADEIPAGLTASSAEQDPRTWVYSPGPSAEFWEDFYRSGMIAIGWDEIGNLRDFPTQDAVMEKLLEAYKPEQRPTNDAKACFEFARVMRPGDRVFAKRGRDTIVGFGIVTGEYEFLPQREQYKHARKMRWEKRGEWKSRPIWNVKTLTDFTEYPEDVRYLRDLVGISEPSISPPSSPTGSAYTIETATAGIAFSPLDFQEHRDLWLVKKNLILQGPPGVGKTFLAQRLAYALIGYELPSQVERVQFHQSYSYEDFIQGFRPCKDGFERKDGVFVRFCKRAALDQDSQYVFILDEINRGNLSKILGEAMVLIESDKRGSKYSVSLTYSDSNEEQFYVPPNVFLLGMMNTADRSLALVDYALRRRFAFINLEPMFSSPLFVDFLVNKGTERAVARAICQRFAELNEAITGDPNLGRGFTIGHSYFCDGATGLTFEEYRKVIQYEVAPLLEEYWFDDNSRVEMWKSKLLEPFSL